MVENASVTVRMQVWALAVGGSEEGLLASGGGDARVQVWQDCTVQDQQEAAQEQEVALLKQQRLSNALQVVLLLLHWFQFTRNVHGLEASAQKLWGCCSTPLWSQACWTKSRLWPLLW